MGLLIVFERGLLSLLRLMICMQASRHLLFVLELLLYVSGCVQRASLRGIEFRCICKLYIFASFPPSWLAEKILSLFLLELNALSMKVGNLIIKFRVQWKNFGSCLASFWFTFFVPPLAVFELKELVLSPMNYMKYFFSCSRYAASLFQAFAFIFFQFFFCEKQFIFFSLSGSFCAGRAKFNQIGFHSIDFLARLGQMIVHDVRHCFDCGFNFLFYL